MSPSSSSTPHADARGFALYVGFDPASSTDSDVTLETLVTALRNKLSELAPDAKSYAAVALAPQSKQQHDVSIVRLALHEPSAIALTSQAQKEKSKANAEVLIDFSRTATFINGKDAELTYTEFELLRYLVLREGRTVPREELVEALWTDHTTTPSERTIDVHVRRLRTKIEPYERIVRTARGVGYRFDRHADVSIDYGKTAPSPDRF